MTLQRVIAQGFDESALGREVSTGRFEIAVRCSQCEALCINGVPCHEHGCPNAVHACRGCSNLVPMRVRYCEDCQ